MVESGLAIFENLVKIFSLKKKHDENYFINFIEPMYKDAEIVMTDYVRLFNDLIKKLESNTKIPDIMKWIEERRIESQPLRMKVRALLNQKSYHLSIADTFQKGIWGLLKGSLSFSETGHGQAPEYGNGDHTVLDILSYDLDKPDSYSRHDLYIELAEKQLDGIKRAWMDIVKGYAEIKQKKMS